MKARRSIGRQKAGRATWRRRVARALYRTFELAPVVAVILLASCTLLFAQNTNTGTASLAVQVAPADLLTITGGTTVSLEIRLGTGPAYLWGDSLSDCALPIGTATTISTSGTYTPLLTAVPFNTTSNDYVCVYDPGTISLNTYVAWPHNGLALAFGQSPTNTAAGVSISPAVTVQVKDSNGVLVASSAASVALAITSGTPATGGPGTLSGTLTQRAVNGVATFNNLSINTAGTGYSLTATSSGMSAGTSNTFNITGGAVDHFAISTISSPQTAGTAFQIATITAKDTNNNTVTSFTSTVTLGGTAGVTGTSAAFTAGVLTNASVTPTVAGSNLTVTVTDGSSHTGLATIATVNPGALDHFKVEKSGGGTIGTQTAGTAFSLRITAQDVNNNTVTSFTSTVSLTSTGALTGSPVTSGTFTAGVLDPQSVTITNTGSFTIAATASGKTGTSAAFTVSAGTASRLVFTTQPGGGTGGTIWSTQPVVTLQDANGNTVTGTAQNVTLAIQNNAGPGGVLSGTLTAAVNTSTGQATFGGLSIDTKGTGYTLTASGSTVDTVPGVVVSNLFNVTLGPATQLIFTTEPVGGIYASPLPTQPVVTVEDAGGNTVTTSSASILLTPSSSSLTGCTNPLAATSGVATFSGCKISTAANGYTLTATSGTLTQAISSPFNVTSGPAGLSAPTVGAQTPNPVPAGSSATYGGTNGITVNISPASACTATMSIAGLPSGASGTFSPNPLVFTTQSGLTSTLTVTTSATTPVGTSSGVNISATGSNGCSGTYTKTTTFVVAAGPGNATNSTVTASPTTVKADGSSTSTITVTLKDANNNLVSGKTVTLAAGSGSSTITTVSGTTNGSGQASFTVKDSTGEAVTYTATDTTDSNLVINQTALVTFTASKLAFSTSPVSVAAGVCSPQITVQTQDSNGNAADPSSTVTVALSSNSTGTKAFYSNSVCGATTTSVTIGTSANSANFWYEDTKAGSPVITAAATGGVTGSPTQTETVNAAGVSASTSTVNSSPASVIADGSTTSTITVTLLDANSNPVTGKTVTLAQGAGNSTISAASGPSNSNGVVTFTVTDAKAQAVTYTATDSTDTVTITNTAIVTFTASKLAFTTAPFNVSAGVCTASAATVQTQDGNGTAVNPPSSVTVTLGSSSTGTYVFYSNSDCNPGHQTTTLTINTSANSANFWYKDTKAGNPVITATATGGLAGTAQTETVVAATPTASNSTVAASLTSLPADGATTSTITVTLNDTYNNPVSGKTVTLTAGSGSSTITTVNGSTNASGQATFSVKDSTAQAVTYTAKDTTENVTVSQTATVTFTASKLAFSTSTFTVTANTCSPVITVQTQDGSGNPTNPPSTVTIALSSTSTSGTGTFYSGSSCSGVITSRTITSSANSVSFYYKNTGTGQETITAAATGGVTSTPTQLEP